MDLFAKFKLDRGPLGKHANIEEGYFMFPKLEGELAPRMKFRGKEVLTWSLNNYLGLGNHPEVRKADAEATADHGLAYPMGARMMSGNTKWHEQLEQQLAEHVQKPAGLLLNYGYQGVLSTIDALIDRRDIVVYDSECHACIIDGLRMHMGKRFVYPHNDIENLEKQLVRATKLAEETGGGILVITEGVFGMTGNMGDLKGIVALKEQFEFRLLVDDAHGYGTLGATGAGAGEEQGVQDQIDVYFSTFAKSMAGIGAFVAGEPEIMEYLKFNMRSQIFAKSLPLPFVKGMLKRLELLRSKPELKDKLWEIASGLQNGLKDRGFNIGTTQSCVTPVYLKGGVGEAAVLAMDLRENYNIFCSVVIYPVVPKDVILLRLIPTAAHSLDDVQQTLEAFSAIKGKLDAGEYQKAELAQEMMMA
ncbi:MAG TPA: 8-amino-7-oxononanoate synthase [Cytophagales bacterium]|nr:8-amino-7-oxononanoate synthase [Cytophagales bacterium]HAA19965.1 8-amino-7-oxononanoate synthase [Cytophagales bacterium]